MSLAISAGGPARPLPAPRTGQRGAHSDRDRSRSPHPEETGAGVGAATGYSLAGARPPRHDGRVTMPRKSFAVPVAVADRAARQQTRAGETAVRQQLS